MFKEALCTHCFYHFPIKKKLVETNTFPMQLQFSQKNKQKLYFLRKNNKLRMNKRLNTLIFQLRKHVASRPSAVPAPSGGEVLGVGASWAFSSVHLTHFAVLRVILLFWAVFWGFSAFGISFLIITIIGFWDYLQAKMVGWLCLV